jgi:hypothetical protein
MSKQNTPLDIQTIDRPYLCQSACLACQNKNNCRVIASTIANLSCDELLRQSPAMASKKLATLVDHLRREGFSFPNVRHSSMCWMHQKFGVAIFYENQLLQLAKKMGQTSSESEQSAGL